MKKLEEFVKENTQSIILQAQEDLAKKESKIIELQNLLSEAQEELKLQVAKNKEGQNTKRKRKGNGKLGVKLKLPFRKAPPSADVRNNGSVSRSQTDFSMEKARYERTIADLRRQLAKVRSQRWLSVYLTR